MEQCHNATFDSSPRIHGAWFECLGCARSAHALEWQMTGATMTQAFVQIQMHDAIGNTDDDHA